MRLIKRILLYIVAPLLMIAAVGPVTWGLYELVMLYGKVHIAIYYSLIALGVTAWLFAGGALLAGALVLFSSFFED
jgi:hypothetical protein